MKQTNIVEKFIDSPLFKRVLSMIPLIALLIICICTNYYYFFDKSYKTFYSLISYTFGFSLFSLMPYFYIVYRFNFCMYTKISLWAILGYILVNIFYWILDNILGLPKVLYMSLFEGLFLIVSLILAMYSIQKELK
ncbi:hypothetical protein [Tenacibaculum phage Larrie]|nr:hypothetical protein [Tenacibaculum phage Larrie]